MTAHTTSTSPEPQLTIAQEILRLFDTPTIHRRGTWHNGRQWYFCTDLLPVVQLTQPDTTFGMVFWAMGELLNAGEFAFDFCRGYTRTRRDADNDNPGREPRPPPP